MMNEWTAKTDLNWLWDGDFMWLQIDFQNKLFIFSRTAFVGSLKKYIEIFNVNFSHSSSITILIVFYCIHHQKNPKPRLNCCLTKKMNRATIWTRKKVNLKFQSRFDLSSFIHKYNYFILSIRWANCGGKQFRLCGFWEKVGSHFV